MRLDILRIQDSVSSFAIGLVLLAASLSAVAADEKPNIVWLISDDLGPELGCYGYADVDTPNLDRLAAEGILYERAFATSPVCSSSRTAFQTGLYQTSIGGHHHVTRDVPNLPDHVPTITELMREAGYFCTNGRGTIEPDQRPAKTHFNFTYTSEALFDGHDWSQRPEGQPFFAQVQFKEPHREFVKSKRPRPNAVIPPYYPEHPVTRTDWANYLASIEVLDEKVGKVLDRLEDEGLANNTLVIFFGDHGRPHVRGKQWLYEGGLHVPLILRWPEKIQAGKVDQGLATLLDPMPTTLAAAGAAMPNLPGANLLKADWRGHDKVYAARDRCGDAIDRIRSVRTDRFKYIRNFHPELPYMQHSGYKRGSYPVDTVMRVLHARGEWTSPFMAETRPEEELYDLSTDPHELRNLAGDPKYAETLAELRTAMGRWIVDTGDLGAIDESHTVNLESVKAGKWNDYVKRMKSRGLEASISDEEYLAWWEEELGVK